MHDPEFFGTKAQELAERTWRMEYYPSLKDHEEAKLSVVWNESLDFTDRDSYLEWVRCWKAAYAAMTTEAHVYKGLYKNWQRLPWDKFRPWAPKPKWTRAARHFMLKIRAEGKTRSWLMRCRRLVS